MLSFFFHTVYHEDEEAAALKLEELYMNCFKCFYELCGLPPPSNDPNIQSDVAKWHDARPITREDSLHFSMREPPDISKCCLSEKQTVV